jgi:antitoxin component of MazEF toxin-antitoxin module
MVKTLVKHGNSWALIIDKPILDLLKITPDMPLEVTTDGIRLVVTRELANPNEQFEKVMSGVLTRYEKTFKKLAE